MSDDLKFHDLSSRHYGLTQAIADSYAEAATVCLDRHHSPDVDFVVEDNGTTSSASASWPAPVDARTKAAWNNVTDTTEFGAYGIALAAVEHTRGLVAISRAETRTGADYYIDNPDKPIDDLETSFRLEVSGMESGADAAIRARLKTKIEQTKKGASNLPALACVVAFHALKISAADAK
ncbi:hypothetical protein [Brevundimonas sp.]|uniref:hypothetical protein n=1 Tax=Brevundimonas sp. TaxID=1871086 RepID=UPI002FC61B83